MTNDRPTEKTEPLTPGEALDEVARRRGQTLAAANRDWSWPSLLLLVLSLVLIGLGTDTEQLGLTTVGIALTAVLAGARVKLRDGTPCGPGTPFVVLVTTLMLLTLFLVWIVAQLAGLAFPFTLAMAAAGLVLLASAPFARRLIERRSGTPVPW